MRRVLGGLALVFVVLVIAGATWLWQTDQYQRDGTLRLAALDRPVRIVRDELGIPYIHAQSLDDAFRAQGFIAAQDHLFSIELSRYLSQGRLAEVIGEAGLKSDIQLRVIGIPRHGRRHAAMLQGDERRRRELYLEGLNAYIHEHADEHPVGLRLLGIEAEPWTLEDSMMLSYFVNWSSSVNVATELIGQAIRDKVGAARAAEISQLTVNPDDGSEQSGEASVADGFPAAALLAADWLDPDVASARLGSNHWVVAGTRSASGAPLVVNDPHIDSRTLPGRWQPLGMITPELRVIGAAGPGLPGFAVARTGRLAYGVTNAYGDVADLYVEQEDPADPQRYLDESGSLPFEVIEETLRIRDRTSPGGFRERRLRIRLTRRGPVISDHGMSVPAGRLLALRWTVPEAMRPDDSGGTDIMLARSVEEARVAIGRVNAPYNYVVADVDGNIGHFTAGRVPVRVKGDGATPMPAEAGETWAGMIPWDRMPGSLNPPRGWAGTANHRTVPAGYPYAYSSYFAGSWRYWRMLELLGGTARHTAAEHWRFMWDTKNTLAARIAPFMAEAIGGQEETRGMGESLRSWDHRDDTGSVAPSVFQATWREFARLTFEDELGTEVAARMLDQYYYWQERLARMCSEPANPWFDDVRTPGRETRDDLFRRAATAARAELRTRLGADLADWRWGRLHRVTFFSPVIPGPWAAALLGGGTHAKSGSGETIDRALYPYATPYDATVIASLRFVADLGDPDKVMAVVSGGASGRQFTPHNRDQLAAWESGEPVYWWFSDEAIANHARHELLLEP